MKRNLKRVLGAVLAGAMILGTMTACGPKEPANDSTPVESSVAGSEAVEAAEITYPLDTDATLKIAIVNDKPIAAVSKDISNAPFAKAWAEQTGVNLEWVVCEDNNAMNLLFADATDLPDLIYWRPYSYAGGPQKAIEDGVMVPFTVEEAAQFAPDFLAAVEAAEEDVRRTMMTDDGEFFGMGMIMDDPALQNASGILVREDWLREFGMEVPNTPEELEAYLQACKDVKGISDAMSSVWANDMLYYGLITSPFGLVKAQEYQVDGTVHFGYAEPEYKEVLAWLNGLAEKDLLDTHFTWPEKSDYYGEKIGCWFNSIGSGIGTYMATMEAEDPEFEVVAVPSLVAKDGDVAMTGLAEKPVGPAYVWITPNCENKELALKFMNYGYTEAGDLLWNFGVEGESFTMVDGVPTYTEWITHNPDGLSMQEAMAQYNRAAVGGGGTFCQSVEYAKQYFWREQQQEATVTWAQHDGYKYRMPNYSVAEADAAEYSRIKADIETYVEECKPKFISGEMSLDDFDTVYIKTLKDMGLDRMQEIVQEACDRFYAR